MIDPGLAVQKAIVAALKADADVGALAADRIFDRAPADVAFPHVEVGEIQVIGDPADCLDAVMVYATLHVWSRAVGKPEAQALAWAVRQALHDTALVAGDGWASASAVHRETRTMTDGDGITTHAVLSFRVLLDPAA